MPKWCHFGRCFQNYTHVQWRKGIIFGKCVLAVLALAVTNNFFKAYLFNLFVIYNYPYGYYNYPHISSHAIDTALYKEAIPVVLKKDLPNCTYEHILQSTHTVEYWEVLKNYDDFDAKGIVNGSYSPPLCNPRFSVAVLVTYRNRQRQLNIFLPYIHNFLQKQNIHYKIYLIEQQDEKPFNRGLLYNIGARQAMADKFPCLILHDVDLLPLDESNLYVCTREPRHLSACIDKFRFLLPYYELIGGVLAIRADQYKQVDGLSNRFLNWGAEDDDFYMRLTEHRIGVTRFPRRMSRYTMLPHAPAPRNPARFVQRAANRRETAEERAADGLARAAAAALSVTPHRLFTRVAVTT